MASQSYYSYDPSGAAAGVVCAIFGINGVYAAVQTIRTRSWIWLVMVFSIAVECVGFAARAVSVSDATSRGPYITQFLTIILAPVFMAGVIYVVFYRIIVHVVPIEARTISLVWIPVRWTTPILVTCDILALLLQGTGGAVIASTQMTDENVKDRLTMGKDIAMAGVAIQLAAFGLFSVVAARFYMTSKQFTNNPNSTVSKFGGQHFVTFADSPRKYRPNWRRVLAAVNISCLLILVRSIYRMVEFSEGKGGYISQHEWFLYVFDALPIALLVVIYNIFFPGTYLPTMGFRAPNTNSHSEISYE